MEYSLTESAVFPFQAEPTHSFITAFATFSKSIFLSFSIWCGFMTVSYRLFRRVILFDFPHDFLGLADRVGDYDLPARGKAA
jgi:hypothetical protein